MKAWIFSIGLMAMQLCCPSVMSASLNEGWYQFSSKDGGCSISFPAQPNLVQQSIQIAEGQYLHYDIYLAPMEDKGVCMLLVATYPISLSGAQEVAGLEGLLKGIVGHHIDNKLIFSRLVEYAGHPAMNFLVRSLSNYFRGQAVMIGNKLYLVAMEGRKSELNETVFERFLESLKIHNRN